MSIQGLDRFGKRIELVKELNRKYPAIAGSHAVSFYKQSFRRKGFIDKRMDKWPARLPTKKGKGRGLMINTGKLRRSIRVTRKGFGFVVIGTDVPYAQIHNEGGTISGTFKVKAHKRRVTSNVKVTSTNLTTKKTTTRKRRLQTGVANVRSHNRTVNTKIPQRQFMGQSEVLMKRITMNLSHELKQIFK